MSHAARGPLHDLVVLEFAGIGPGPFAATLLADLGARVIRIERPGGTTSVMPAATDPTRRSRESVLLDLRTPDGAAAARALAKQVDVLVEGNRPGVMERLGLGPDELLASNERLVYARMTGWGQSGPLAGTAGHDISYLAITGALGLVGREGEPPTIPANILGDLAGGALYLVVGILAALVEARRSGLGQVVDGAIVDGAVSLTMAIQGLLDAGQWRDERGVNLLDGGRPWYDTYETADGRRLAIGPLEPRFYREFMEAIGLDPDETERADPDTWPALRARIDAAVRSRTSQEWDELFRDRDACVAPVLSLAEARQHPHLKARAAFVNVGGQLQAAPAPRFGRTALAAPTPAATPGADTRRVLAEFGIVTGGDGGSAGG